MVDAIFWRGVEQRERERERERYLATKFSRARWLLLKMKRFLQRHLIFRDDVTAEGSAHRCAIYASLAYSARERPREMYLAAGNWRKLVNPSARFIARARSWSFSGPGWKSWLLERLRPRPQHCCSPHLESVLYI